MDDKEREHFIKLCTFTFGISLDVLHLYFEIKILDKKEFFFFLDGHKHVLFHALRPAVSCCECRNRSIPLSKKLPTLYLDQFNLLFDIDNSTLHCLHNTTVQNCLCKYSASRSVKVDSLDISLVNAIVMTCCESIHGNPKWIKDIKDTRNFLAHKGNCRLTKEEYDTWLTTVEKATLDLAEVISPTSLKMIQKQISDLKRDVLFSNTVQDILARSNDDVCKRLESLVRNMVIQESKSMSRDIIDHIIKKTDEIISIHINELLFAVKTNTHVCEQLLSQKITEGSIETGCATSTPQTAQPQSTESKNERSIETGCATSTPQTAQPQSTESKNENKCRVEWKLATPDTWSVSEIKDTLQNHSGLKQWFEIENVYIGSLVIRTIVPEHILSNYDDFKSAVRSFLAKIVEVCQLDTDTPTVVKVDLNIFTEIPQKSSTNKKRRIDHAMESREESNPGTCGAPATAERSIQCDDLTSESSQINITGARNVVFGDQQQTINIAEVDINNMKRYQREKDVRRPRHFGQGRNNPSDTGDGSLTVQSSDDTESSTSKKRRIDHAMEPRDGPRHFGQRRSSSSGTEDGSQVPSSSDTGSRRRVHTVSTSSTDPSSFGVPYMSTESNPGTCGAPATGERSIQGDDLTSESSQINITGANKVVIGDDITINIPEVIINHMKRNKKEEDVRREETFIEQFKSIAPLFVETKRYKEAKIILENNHLVLITGSSGEGKSFMAKKLVQEKIDQGYNLKEVDNIIQWREHVHWRKRQVVFIDDLFGLSHHTDKDDNHQKLIYEVGLIKDDGNKSEDLLYVIMTCRNSVLIRIKQHLKTSQVFEKSNIVNLSTIELTQRERLQMIENHLSKYRENNTLDDAVKQSISTCDCPFGFPYCVYMFTTITKLFLQGKQFFISPIKNVRREVHRLHTSDSDVYALLVFLLIKGGEIKEETLHRLGEDSNEFKLLKNIVHFPSAIQLGIRLQSALKRVDEAFVMKNGTNLQFRHSCVSDAMCISFSRNMEHIAIQWLPFDFIINRIRTDDFEKSMDDEIVTICEKVYKDLANRFVEEIELGNISKVCKHQALKDPCFVVHFIGILEALKESDIGKLRLFLQVTEQENQFGALLNGSLLYWTSSLDMRYLCSSLLERKFYDKDIIEDRFWVQTQASAALVPACWYGFESSALQDLLNLGADINSSLHEIKKLQTHHCDYCTVHDQDGMTTIQASVFGDDKHKDETVKFLLDKGAHFKELSKHRPLIRAIKIYNKEFDSGPADMNITRRTICTLLERGADINWKDQNDRTAFWYIVINNNIDIARLLISKCRNIFPQSLLPFAKSIDMAKLLVENNIDTDFSQKDNLGKTLLHRVQHESLVQYFIDNNCSVQQRDSDGRTPIFYSQTLPICEKLIQNRSSINTEDYEQKTVFHFIKRTEILEYLLNAFPRDEVRRIINKEDMFKRTPIFTCTSLTVLRLFKNHGADVNHQAKEYSVRGKELEGTCQHIGEKIYNISLESTTKETKLSSVLVYTANYIMNIPENYSEVPDDELEAMDQLTNTLCSVNTTDSYSKSTSNTRSTKTNNSSDNCSEENDEETNREDYTVAMKLALSGKLTLEIIQELKKNGANFNITDDEGNTFIHYLLTPEHKVNQVVSIIETVLDPNDDQLNGRLVNAKNSCGNTPLHLACSCSDLNKLLHSRKDVATLLQPGADVHAQNKSKETPLHSRKDVVATLLQSGADVHAKNKSKETPLHCLLKCTCTDKYEISKLLQKKGLNEEDVYNQNQGGELAIEQICSLQDQSKRFLNDAKNTILSLYKNLTFKDYLLQQIEFFLKRCNISLIETVFECCLGMSTDDRNEVRQWCVSENYRLSVNSWVIMSSDDLIDKRERLSDIKLELTERHNLLKDCIVRVQSRTTRIKILHMIMHGIEDINATDSKGRSFLINAIIACRYRRNDLHRVIKYFLETGSDPNIRDVDGFTAYHHCILSNTGDEYVYKCTKLLSDNKASLSIGKPLLLLVDINRIRTKNIIFLPGSVPPNQKDEKGNAFHHLMIAYSKYASNFHVLTTSISALIDRGVDINMYNEDGETPLHVAMRCQVQSHVILEMLRNGADVKREKKRSNHDNENVSMEIDSETQDDITHDVTRNDNGRSAFEYMLIHQQNIKLQVVREMLKYGADPFHQDKNGQNSFHLLTSVVKSNCLKILLLLLKYCKNTEDNLSMCDKNRDTPLHIACTFSNNDEVWCTSLRVAVIRVLLASGASINKVNECGQTPFHLLIGQYCQLTNNFRIEDNKIIHNIIVVLGLFLSYKANMTIKDKKGLSVLDVINENINSDLQRFIQNQIGAVALMNLLDKTPTKEGTTDMA